MLALRTLASRYGVQPTYGTIGGGRASASTASLAAVLRALGAPVDDTGRVLDEESDASARLIEPITVAWEGKPAAVVVRPNGRERGRIECNLTLESGEQIDLAARAEEIRGEAGKAAYRVQLPQLPRGYHRLEVQHGSERAVTLVLAAPERCFSGAPERVWGIFAPAYALHDAETLGFGSVRELATLGRWAASRGAALLGTLPLLAGELAQDASPYRPISRLFWNESYVDISGFDVAPEIDDQLRAAANEELIDYGVTSALKRKTLEGAGVRAAGADDACSSLNDYARYRAAGERYGALWRAWPARLRDGTIDEGDIDARAVQYHRASQQLIARQLTELSDELRGEGVQLHLDLPLGVHPDGYDTWRFRAQFMEGCSAGAPPDGFMPLGQNWTFPPPHPTAMRDAGYEYLIRTLRHHMKHAGLLRIDHVMGLHRLYVIPDGFDARDGVYVRYPADELYAILAIESHRNGCAVVGENLGTVPGYVNRALSRHGLHGMHVAAFRHTPDARGRLPVPRRDSVASMNTHDTFPFTGFWCGDDIDDRLRRGLLHAQDEMGERAERATMRDRVCAALGISVQPSTADGAARALRAWLRVLSVSPAQYVMVNAEDLWCEREPQNRPGTGAEFPNWRRRFRVSLEEMAHDAGAAMTLAAVTDARPRTECRA